MFAGNDVFSTEGVIPILSLHACSCPFLVTFYQPFQGRRSVGSYVNRYNGAALLIVALIANDARVLFRDFPF